MIPLLYKVTIIVEEPPFLIPKATKARVKVVVLKARDLNMKNILLSKIKTKIAR